MKILKQALGAFVEFDETPKKDSSTSVKSEPSKEIPTPVTNVSNQAEVNLKFQKHFQELMKALNLPGPDLLEFLQVIDDLKDDFPDDDIKRFKIANKTLKIPKEKLLESGKYYIKAIQDDKTKFLESVSQKQNIEIQDRKNKIKELELLRSKNNEMIQKLNEENQNAALKAKALEDEVREQESKIENNKAGYLQASESFVNNLNNHISRIQTL